MEAEVLAIARALDAPGGAGRGEAAVRLSRLRDRYRAEPLLFVPDTLDRLRELAAALRRPPPRRAGPSLDDARGVLRDVFGHSGFRPGQEAIVAAALEGRDCVGVMPTGAGKSLTYQLPARLLGGTTLVVSPLIALMKDQVDAMGRAGLRATFLNSTLSAEERRDRVRALRRGEVELLYAAPEGLEASVGGALEGIGLSLIAVDEAHCISHWGHDFRPAYRNLAGLKDRFGAPVLALTATATPAVTRDIATQLGMADPLVVTGSFLRRNLKLHAVKKGGDGPTAREAILRIVRSRRGESGIVYALGRKTVESTAGYLADHGVRVEPYHAGMEPDARARVQDAFREGTIDVVVATVAFGMGIDKPDIRFVLHQDLPRSIEAYSQEVGRAGRDGQDSDCVLFYSWADVVAWDRMAGDDPEVAEAQQRQVRAMFRFADEPGCRHERLCGWFGEVVDPCGDACDACTGADPLAGLPRVARSRGARERGRGGRDRDRRARRPAEEEAELDLELFEALRAWRAGVAKAQAVPAFVVFSDATLAELAQARPRSEEALLEVKGIGPRKLKAYGAALLELLRG
ncbi:MAG TPA: ATP-dependent DNA helicase RecQ [Anaeromyxobacteraceae bacterium]|nr:ATP-dependent DNA helicase RecQ [Anaeromyxobacteraceae bacterium]